MRRRMQCAAWLLAAVALGGCVNLEGIGTYAGSAAGVVGTKDAAARWRDSEKRLVEAKLEGDVCPIGRTGRRPQAEFDAAFAEVASLHDLMANYFKAIGELASDKVPDVATTAKGSLDALKAVVPVGAAEEASANALSKVLNRALDAYRQKHLRELMLQTHDDVARVLGVMEKLADVYAGEVRGEGIQALNFVKCSIGQGDLSDKYLGRRALVRVQARYDAEAAALAAYKKSLQKVAADHAAILQALALDKEGLKRSLKAIAATAKELDKARDAVSAL
jgi:hypothetical protein